MMSRRSLLKASAALAAAGLPLVESACAGGSPRPNTLALAQEGSPMIVQLSRGRFPADRLTQVQRIFEGAKAELLQELRGFPGLLGTYAGIEPGSSTFVNVSVWDSLEHAQQMNGSKALKTALREPAMREGTAFDLFANYPVAWKLGDAASSAGKGAAKVIRVSKGAFDADKTGAVDSLMRGSQKELGPAIERLPGMVAYYVGTDSVTATVTHISFWDSADHAQQMSTLKEMMALREPAVAIGIRFEPQSNYPISWGG